MKPIMALFTLLLLGASTEGGGYLVEVKSVPPAAAESSDRHNLTLPLEVDLQVAESFVRIGFGLKKDQRFQSYEFLTPRLRTAQAVPLIRLIKQYNGFNGERVAAAVEKLRGRISGLEFGREGSPVLYIELPHWSHQREEADTSVQGTRITDAENDRLVEELRQVFVDELKADEFGADGRRVRVWWD
ncbi:hypothetical protein [Hydrogenophaga sp. RWCD_12]|uniref:hypothetical protein n=1 Tax=Hydrogenophaga sp. RWCD_12 TaxID=3391190 RepID=UPI003984FE9C